MNKREIAVEALLSFGTMKFTDMTNLANAHKATNLSQGFPDFDGPESARARAAEAILRGLNQYALSSGIAVLRQAVAHKIKRFCGFEVDPETEVTVTSGATEGLCATLLEILEPRDEIIIEPAYDICGPLASLARTDIRYVSLNSQDFSLPRGELASAFSSKTKAILVNTPMNPCGKVFSRDDLETISSHCLKHDTLAVSDEVYEHPVYDGRKQKASGSEEH